MIHSPLFIVLAFVLAALVVAVIFLALKRRNTSQLKSKFGSEYSRVVEAHDSQGQAEADLLEREKRAKKIQLRPLGPTDRARFVESWRAIQTRFVDDPGRSVTEADALLGEVMTARGYPVGDFEQRSADVSVDYPEVVQHYHTAHAIALRHAEGSAGTEDLRVAMISYRTLFDDLAGDTAQPAGAHPAPPPTPAPTTPEAQANLAATR
jgi:hypothetical protein